MLQKFFKYLFCCSFSKEILRECVCITKCEKKIERERERQRERETERDCSSLSESSQKTFNVFPSSGFKTLFKNTQKFQSGIFFFRNGLACHFFKDLLDTVGDFSLLGDQSVEYPVDLAGIQSF